MRKELILYKIQSKDNVGSIYRIAYQMGITKIYSYLSSKPGRTNTYKTERHIPIIEIDDLSFLENVDIPRIAIETGGADMTIFPSEFIVCVGNENEGISKEDLKYFQFIWTLKSIRRESFNVSHALAIGLYRMEFPE